MDIYEIRKQNLVRLIGERRKAACAELWGMSPAHLSQILSEKTRKNLGDDVARRIEEREGLARGWLDTLQGDPQPTAADEDDEYEPRIPHKDDYALIPQYTAKAACGDGYMNGHVEVKGSLAFKREWLAKMKAKPENLRVMYADGDSMEPYIFEGEVVLFDTSEKEPRDKKVFVIRRPNGGLSIKRLAQRLDGTWIVSSDNPDKTRFRDETYLPDALHEIPIVGRVIWRGGEVD